MDEQPKFTASLIKMKGVHWFTVSDDENVYIHADDGDFQYRIKVPKDHPNLKLMCTSAVLALESQVRSTRLKICRLNYGSMH
jgi:hypothetical protein